MLWNKVNTPLIARITDSQSYRTTYNEVTKQKKKHFDIILTMGISLWNVPFIKTQKRQFSLVMKNKSQHWSRDSSNDCLKITHKNQRMTSWFVHVMFKKRAGVFYRVFDPIKHVLRVFWTASKTFLEKRVSREFITIMLLLEISIQWWCIV